MSTFQGTNSDDTLDGTSESDLFLMGSGGDDTVNGEGGSDVFDFKHAFTEGDSIIGGAGNDTLKLKGNYARTENVIDNVHGVETIQLAPHHFYDFLIENSVIAPGAKLTVNGNALGADGGMLIQCNVADGTVKLVGGAGFDVLLGGQHGDVFIGGGGADQLKGDDGLSAAASADKFVYSNISDSTVAAPDTVYWDPTAGDRIDLHRIDADTTAPGNQAFEFIGTSSFSHTAGELRYEDWNGTGYVISGDVNGDGTVDFAIQVTNNNLALPGSLVSSEFIL